MASTPGILVAASVSMRRISPLAIVLPTGTAYTSFGKLKSDVYMARPLTFEGPSTRGMSFPRGDILVFLSGGMVKSPISLLGGSGGLGCRFKRMYQTALRQLNFETVFGLW